MARKKSSLKQLSDIGPYLTTSGAKKKLINYRFYLQTGAVKIAVTCSAGKDALVALLCSGDFFAEGCIADQPGGFRRRPLWNPPRR
jgi:CRP-like cAMP-binding protein